MDSDLIGLRMEGGYIKGNNQDRPFRSSRSSRKINSEREIKDSQNKIHVDKKKLRDQTPI